MEEKEKETKTEEGEKARNEESLAKAYREQKSFNFLGFAIFDIIHIVMALCVFATLFANQANSLMDLVEAIVEIILSVTLIGFIHALAEDRHSEEQPAKYISYAWLLAISSLLIPSAIEVTHFFIEGEEWTVFATIDFAVLILELITYLAFFVSMFFLRYSRFWKILCYLGMILFALCGLLEIFYYIFLDLFPMGTPGILLFIFQLIKNIAPFILAGFGLVGLYKVDVSENGRLL